MILPTWRCTIFNSIPIILILLTKKRRKLIYSVTISPQKTKEIIDTNSDQKITCDELKRATRDVADGEPSCDWSARVWIEEPDIIVLCHLLCGSRNLSDFVQHVTLVYSAVLTYTAFIKVECSLFQGINVNVGAFVHWKLP